MSVVCMVIRQLNQIFVFSENDSSSVGDALPPMFCPTSHPFSSHLSAGHPLVAACDTFLHTFLQRLFCSPDFAGAFGRYGGQKLTKLFFFRSVLRASAVAQ